MSYATQPIAVAPRQTDNPVYTNGYASFSPHNVFTATGSPMSFRSGSFQNRFYPGGSPGQLGPIAVPDLKRGSWDGTDWLKAAMRTGSSAIDMHGRINGNGSSQSHSNSFVFENELCRNYTCCGLVLPDLHALLDHFENTHVEVVADDDSATPPLYTSTHSSPDAFDADDMEISPSPPATPSPTTPFTSAFDAVRVESSSSMAMSMSPFFRPSTYSSLAGGNGSYNYPANVHYGNNFAANNATTPNVATATAFNRYAGYSDYSSNLPGTDPSPTYHYQLQLVENDKDGEPEGQGKCVPPALLFSNSTEPSPLNTPASSRTNSPDGAGAGRAPKDGASLSLHPDVKQSRGQAHGLHGHTSSSQQTFSSRPGSSNAAMTSSKPFRCPKPGCNKSYKQQNGLKYHLSHGQCNFAPRDPEVEKLSEVERERRLRPFVCMVSTNGTTGEGCGRRYKNMNGLRYHYTHTGEHGAIGLEMLAQNRHPLPEVGCGSASQSPSHSPRNTSSSSVSPASAVKTSPGGVPSKAAMVSSVSGRAPVALPSLQGTSQPILPLHAHAPFAQQQQQQQQQACPLTASSISNTSLTTPLTSSANTPLGSRQGSPTTSTGFATARAATFGTVPMPSPSLVVAQGQAWNTAPTDVIMG